MATKKTETPETVESPQPVEEPTGGTPDTAQDDGDAALTDKQQAIIDSRIKRELAKARERFEAEMVAEKERLAKEAREAQLLEKENFKELYETAKAEADRLRQDTERRALDEKTDALLDNAEITTPSLRRLIRELPPDLEVRAERINELRSTVDEEAEARVAKRLYTKAPERGSIAGKRLADMTAEEKNEFRTKHGDAAFIQRVREEAAVSQK